MKTIAELCADELADVLDTIEERGEEPMLYLLSYLHGFIRGLSEGREPIPLVVDLGESGIRVEIIDDMSLYEDGARLH